MNLLQRIKGDRTGKKRKLPFRPTLFNRIGGLVKAFILRYEFLDQLDSSENYMFKEHPEFDRIKAKPDLNIPLFSLLTEDEYRVAKGIMIRVNNPYLYYVNSPDEILLCNTLFSRHPSLEPDRLARCHFETLLLCELAKEKVRDLNRRAEEIREKKGEISEDEQNKFHSFLGRSERLEAFIGDVEKTQPESKR